MKVFYLKQKRKEAGEPDGSNPAKVATPIHIMDLQPLKQTQKLEEQLTAEVFKKTYGS